MATAEPGPIVTAISGRIGGITFRKRGAKCVISSNRHRPTTTAGQVSTTTSATLRRMRSIWDSLDPLDQLRYDRMAEGICSGYEWFVRTNWDLVRAGVIVPTLWEAAIPAYQFYNTFQAMIWADAQCVMDAMTTVNYRYMRATLTRAYGRQGEEIRHWFMPVHAWELPKDSWRNIGIPTYGEKINISLQGMAPAVPRPSPRPVNIEWQPGNENLAIDHNPITAPGDTQFGSWTIDPPLYVYSPYGPVTPLRPTEPGSIRYAGIEVRAPGPLPDLARVHMPLKRNLAAGEHIAWLIYMIAEPGYHKPYRLTLRSDPDNVTVVLAENPTHWRGYAYRGETTIPSNMRSPEFRAVFWTNQTPWCSLGFLQVRALD